MQEEGWRKSPSENYAAEAKAQLCLCYADLLIFWGTCRQSWMPHAGLPVSNCPRGTQFQLTIMEYMNRMRKRRKKYWTWSGHESNCTHASYLNSRPNICSESSDPGNTNAKTIEVSDSNPPCHWKKELNFLEKKGWCAVPGTRQPNHCLNSRICRES